MHLQSTGSVRPMDTRDKQLAEAVLRRLCKEAHIDGIRFGPILQILISHVNRVGDDPINGQVYLNLGSSWKVFDSRPASLPNGEEELPQATAEEQIQAICDLRECAIINAEICEKEPHLILTLEDGRVLFVNGKHDLYECWDMGVAFSVDKWQVIACPGDDVAIWAPKSFIPSVA